MPRLVAQTLLPFGVAVRLGRKRIERRPVDRLQQLSPALADLAHDLGVEVGHTLPDGGVEVLQREEPPVPQPRQDEALDDEDRDFHPRLRGGRLLALSRGLRTRAGSTANPCGPVSACCAWRAPKGPIV